jgi:PAS domain S-box-containing protein
MSLLSYFKKPAFYITFTGIITLVLFSLVGAYYRKSEKKKILDDKVNELEIITNLKTEQLLSWHKSRIAESEYFSGTRPFSQYINEIVTGNHQNENIFRENLLRFMQRSGYQNIILTDSSANVLFAAVTQSRIIDQITLEGIGKTYKTQSLVTNDFYFCKHHNTIHYELISPVFDNNGNVSATLVFRINPNEFIFPLLEKWPGNSKTAQTILLRQEGDSLRFLSNLNNNINRQMSNIIAFDRVVQDFRVTNLQQPNTFISYDYQGKQIIGHAKRVAGTSWIMMVKQDMAEVNQTIKERDSLIILLKVISFLIISMVVAWVHIYRNKLSRLEVDTKKLQEEELRRTMAEARSQLLAYAARNNLQKTLRETLDKVCKITQSPIGFAHFLEKDQENIATTAWSQETENQFSQIIGKYNHNTISKAGVWADAVRERKTIIHNNFAQTPNKKGFPPGHPQISREVIVPVIRNKDIVAVLAIGNKTTPYTNQDIFMAEFLADVVWEIAENKFNEERLLQSEKKYRYLFNDHSAAKLILDAQNGNITDANPSAATLYGTSIEQLKETTLSQLLDRQNRQNTKSLETLFSQKSCVCQQVHVKSDGKKLYTEVYGSHIEFSGKEYIHLIIHDVTEKKFQEKSQEILYKITRNSMSLTTLETLASVVKDELGKLMDTGNFLVALYNPQKGTLKKLFLANPDIELDQWSAEKSLSGYVVRNGQSLIQKKEECLSFAKLNNLDLPQILPECWIGVPMISEGKTIGVVAMVSYDNPDAYDKRTLLLMEMIAHELSIAVARATLIEDLVLAKEKAELSDRMKTSFIGNISHEIKTPMNAILGFVDLLSDNTLEQQERESYINIIKEAGQRLTKTIGSLIEISKIAAGFAETQISNTNIPNLLSYQHNLQLPQAQAKGLQFLLEHSLPQNFTIATDQLKLEGIFQNLISNAIKFTKKGAITIKASLDKGNLVFEVSDTGVGIPKTLMNRVFKPFEILDYSLNREHQGAGLGLAIVKSYIDAIGGQITVESTENQGTTFTFTIPA